jgi:hypothetical protein
MLTRLASAALALLMGGSLALADTPKGTVEGTIVKVDAAKKTITVKTDSGTKRVIVSDQTQFFGQRGGAASDGINDDRLAPGASVQILMTSNNRWAKEVHILSVPTSKSNSPEDNGKPVRGAARITKPELSKGQDEATPTPAQAVQGTIVKMNTAKKTITIKTDSGNKTISISKETQFVSQRGGAPVPGISDERLAPGATVRILTTPNNRWAKEVLIVSVPREGSSTDDSTKPTPGAARSTKPAASNDEDQATETPARRGARVSRYAPGIPSNALKGTIVSVSRAHSTITIDVNGTKTDYVVNDETQFIGPREGMAAKGIRDDRVVEGSPVSIVVSGKTLKEVHLPYRNRIPK